MFITGNGHVFLSGHQCAGLSQSSQEGHLVCLLIWFSAVHHRPEIPLGLTAIALCLELRLSCWSFFPVQLSPLSCAQENSSCTFSFPRVCCYFYFVLGSCCEYSFFVVILVPPKSKGCPYA